MKYLHIFAPNGDRLACILTNAPERSLRSWLRANPAKAASWYAAAAA